MNTGYLSPKICGEWDGCHIWLQWETSADAASYELEIAYSKDGSEWSDWENVVPPQGNNSSWGIVPTWKEGWRARARVRAVQTDGSVTGWEPAVEIQFAKGLCEFEILSSRDLVHFQKGTTFHAVVDGGAACYVLEEEVSVPAGGRWQGKMVHNGASGWHQLDFPGHFELRPALGVAIRNVSPSSDETMPTGRNETLISAAPPAAMTLSVLPPDHF